MSGISEVNFKAVPVTSVEVKQVDVEPVDTSEAQASSRIQTFRFEGRVITGFYLYSENTVQGSKRLFIETNNDGTVALNLYVQFRHHKRMIESAPLDLDYEGEFNLAFPGTGRDFGCFHLNLVLGTDNKLYTYIGMKNNPGGGYYQYPCKDVTFSRIPKGHLISEMRDPRERPLKHTLIFGNDGFLYLRSDTFSMGRNPVIFRY